MDQSQDENIFIGDSKESVDVIDRRELRSNSRIRSAKLELVDEDYEPQGEDREVLESTTELSLCETMRLFLGLETYRQAYPMDKIIRLDNQNPRENEVDEYREQNTEAHPGRSLYKNQISVSSALIVFRAFLRAIVHRPELYFYLGISILMLLVDEILAGAQYIPNKFVYIIFWSASLLLGAIFETANIFRKAPFEQPEDC